MTPSGNIGDPGDRGDMGECRIQLGMGAIVGLLGGDIPSDV